MAKGLRSKSKRKFRTLKREEVFKPVEDARLARLADKQAEAAGAIDMKVDEEESVEAPVAGAQPENTMVEAEAPKRGRSRAKQMDIDGDEGIVAAAAASMVSDLRDAIEKDSLYLSRRKFKKKMEQRKKSAVRAKSATRKKSSKR
ncbi:hypothetical protein BJ742DRAFT_852185 [Cladochytrium replicatum]|nr:hypothetical protein BJ742DRAFT_852185 [Cladochytrium replicatum]